MLTQLRKFKKEENKNILITKNGIIVVLSYFKTMIIDKNRNKEE
jgi:hypothetical protein